MGKYLMSRYFTELKLVLPRPLMALFGNFLIENGCKGFIIEENSKDRVVLKGYLRQNSRAKVLIGKINRYTESLNELHRDSLRVEVELKRIKEENWSRNWRKSFKPIQVTDKIVIRPSWVKKRFPQKIVIEIEPKMAFGTGGHSTTKMCLRVLQKYVKQGDKILDLGTGSGILAIAAAKLDASYVLALDIDSEAINNAKENIIRNKVQRIVDLRLGTLDEKIPGNHFDIIVANLTKTEIIKLFDKMSLTLKEDGLFILSGIQKKEKKKMEEFVSEKSLLIKEALSDEGWVCFVAKKVKK